MKEKTKQQPTSSKQSSHNTLDWVEKQLRDVVAFDMGLSINNNQKISVLCPYIFNKSDKKNEKCLGH